MKNFLTQLCVLVVCLLSVNANAIITVHDAGNDCIDWKWMQCGCFPWYSSSVEFSQSPSGPPCSQSYLVAIPQCGPNSGNMAIATSTSGGAPTNGTFNYDPTTGNVGYTPAPPSGSQSVANNSSQPQTYMQTLNGVPTGNGVIVPPGGTGVIPITGDPTTGNWGLYPVPADTIVALPPNQTGTQNANGSYNFTGATMTAGIGNVSGGGGATSEFPISTNYVNTNQIFSSPPNINYTGSNAPGYVATNSDNTLPNAPVPTNSNNGNYTGGSTTTNTVSQSNLTQNINGLIQANANNNNDLIKAIENMDNANRLGHTGTSNEVNRGDNTLVGMSNLLGIIATNTSSQTNTNSSAAMSWLNNLNDPTALTNQANANGANDANAFTFMQSSALVGVASPALGHNPSVWIVSAGGYTFNMDPVGSNSHGMASIASMCYNALYWLATAIFYAWLINYCMTYVRDLPKMRQLELPNITVAGNSVGFLLTLTYMAVMITAMGFIPQLLLSFTTTHHAGLMSTIASDPFAGVSGTAGASLGLAEQFIPISYLITLFGLMMADYFLVGQVYTAAGWLVRTLVKT